MIQENLSIIRLYQDSFDAYLEDLANLLHACVHDGASVGFILPFSLDESRTYWLEKVRPSVVDKTVVLWIAKLDQDVVAGTVQLDCNTMPNQAHRAQVSKLLVSPDHRRLGVAKALMSTLEKQAIRQYKSLLTLDTRTDDKAEPLYTSLGYSTVGVIPFFARDPFAEHFDGTTIMYKRL